MQPAVFADLHYSNIGSFFALLKAARRAQYKHVALFFRKGPFSLFGYANDALNNIFANLRFR